MDPHRRAAAPLRGPSQHVYRRLSGAKGGVSAAAERQEDLGDPLAACATDQRDCPRRGQHPETDPRRQPQPLGMSEFEQSVAPRPSCAAFIDPAREGTSSRCAPPAASQSCPQRIIQTARWARERSGTVERAFRGGSQAGVAKGAHTAASRPRRRNCRGGESRNLWQSASFRCYARSVPAGFAAQAPLLSPSAAAAARSERQAARRPASFAPRNMRLVVHHLGERRHSAQRTVAGDWRGLDVSERSAVGWHGSLAGSQ